MDVPHSCLELCPGFSCLIFCHVHSAPHVGSTEDLQPGMKIRTDYRETSSVCDSLAWVYKKLRMRTTSAARKARPKERIRMLRPTSETDIPTFQRCALAPNPLFCTTRPEEVVNSARIPLRYDGTRRRRYHASTAKSMHVQCDHLDVPTLLCRGKACSHLLAKRAPASPWNLPHDSWRQPMLFYLL